VKRISSTCKACLELKPRFYNASSGHLIKATQPFERLSIDFKGPLPSNTRNRYLLTIVDEYSRFPFAFPCSDMFTSTVIKCLNQLFSIFGMPAFIHSDRGSSFMSTELTKFLCDKGVAMSHTTSYNPQSNGQVERLNGTLWKTVCLALKTRNIPLTHWEVVLPDALHSLRSLLCTATNCTPHERIFHHPRRSTSGTSLPSWLSVPGPVYLKRCDRSSKYDPLVEEVELVMCNPQYAHIKHADGKQETVSLRRLSPRNVESPAPTPSVPSSNLSPPIEHHAVTENSDNDVQGNSSTGGSESSLRNRNTTSSYSELLRAQQRVHSYNLRNREA